MKRQDRDYSAGLRKRRVWFADADDDAAVEPDAENANRTTEPDTRGTGKDIKSLDEAIEALAAARDEAASRRVENGKLKKQMADIEKQLRQLQQDREAREDAELTQQNKFKELADKYKSQLDTLETQLREQQAQFLRVKIAVEEHVPDFLADRLRGTTEEELRADAKRLAELVQPHAQATPDAPPSAEPDQPQPPNDVERRRHTTAAPGGPPIGRTDADRRAMYFNGSPQDSPMFADIDVIMPPSNEG